jgi:transketolase
VQDHFTYVIAGDGCLMEGVSHEAIGIAGRQKLSRLIVLWDDNGITIDGKVALSDVTDQKARFAASGWDVFSCDGHNPDDIDRALTAAKASPGPAMVACKTHIAFGHAAQDTSKGHGALTDKAQLQAAKDAYGWPHGPFDIPADIKRWWEGLGAKGAKDHADWHARLNGLPAAKQAEFERVFNCEVPSKLSSVIRAVKKQAVVDLPKLATRAASEKVLTAVNPIMPESIGGSADLTGSNNTKTPDLGVFEPGNRKGRYVNFGIREHGMAAAMNGMALHGGIRPYGGTFMAFTDYARPAMRLSALMGVPVVYVMTHDSIGLGEDGPTHQPVEHLAISRATPNTLVLRPADLVEVAECWEVALTQKTTPSVMALSRQNLAAVRKVHTNQNLSAKGAYILAEATGKRQVILIATGSEVKIAIKAREALEAEGIGTRVVSMPSMELFAAEGDAYRRKVLPAGSVRVAIEAGVRQGWDRWLLGERGRDGKAAFIGMSTFGASAPYERLYNEFGITAEAVVAAAKAML